MLILDDTDGPTAIAALGGQAIVFSVRGPDKALNEDAAAVLAYDGGGMLVVADGMGGQAAGQLASRLALETLAEHLVEGAARGQALRHAVIDGIEAANRAVLALGVGAGTTLAALLLQEGRARAIHVGDSVAMHVGQRGRIKTLTVSHSPTGYAVEAGLLGQEDALQHAERHVVSNHVGMEGMRIEVGSAIVIARHDTLLLASDGLVDNLTPEEIVEIVRKGPLARAAQKLSALARHRMADDRSTRPSKPDDLTYVLYRRASE